MTRRSEKRSCRGFAIDASGEWDEQRVTREQIVFHGRVQGVYFRATTQQLARGLALCGFVRNRADGTVELQAQGEPDEIERLLTAVEQHYRGHVDRVERTTLPLHSGETGLRIER